VKLIIEFDPFVDRENAVRAAAALTTLGLPAEMREGHPMRQGSADQGPVQFEPLAPAVEGAK
jgi:hypothetical protein